MGRVLLLFTVLCNVLFAEPALDIQKKKVVIRKLAQCKGQNDLPMEWSDALVTHDESSNNNFFLNLKVEMAEDIEKDLSIVFNFWKCDASGNPASCEYVLKNKNISNICTYMAAKNQAWTPFIEHFDKPLKCPIKRGIYTLKDCPVNSAFLRFLPVTDALWKVQLDGSAGGRKVSCVELLLQILPYYSSKRS